MQPSTWNEAIEYHTNAIRALMSRKNLAYGKESITEAGPMGIISKLLSKIHRLRGLIVRDVERQYEDTTLIIGEETVKDTLMDIAAYALIYLTVMDDTFKLPTTLEVFDEETGVVSGVAAIRRSNRGSDTAGRGDESMSPEDDGIHRKLEEDEVS